MNEPAHVGEGVLRPDGHAPSLLVPPITGRKAKIAAAWAAFAVADQLADKLPPSIDYDEAVARMEAAWHRRNGRDLVGEPHPLFDVDERFDHRALVPSELP